jgi:NAD(P)-dependent dehydrogenase (short-subunit alcohol dehydrogenase family)
VPDAAALVQRLFDVRGLGAVVTGAASGLGLAIAEVLASAGARVTLADADAGALDRVTAELAAQGATVRGQVLDVADPAAVDDLLRGVADEPGGLSLVFANAGISAGPGPALSDAGRIENVDLARWNRVLDVNLTGVFTTIQAAVAPLRRAGGGSIVATASIAGLRGHRLVGYAYAATKAGVANLVRQAAGELARDGIRVNAIAPGAFRTNIGGGGDRTEIDRAFVADAPMGRIAMPDEIKGLALFLASPAAGFITGETIAIDGGALACTP